MSEYLPAPRPVSPFTEWFEPPRIDKLHLTDTMAGSVVSWDKAQVGEWLRSLSCSQYIPLFDQNEINGEVLLEMDQKLLKDMGISKVGDRVRINVAIKELRRKSNNSAATKSSSRPSAKTLSFLDEQCLSPFLTSPVTPPGRHHSPPPTTATTTVESPLSQTPRGTSSEVKGILSMDEVRQGTVKFIYSQGQTKTVNISGCFNAESIIRMALKKMAIKDSSHKWCVHVSDKAFATSTRVVSDNELVTICHSPSRIERRRLLLCLRDSLPSQEQLQKSQSVLLESVDSTKPLSRAPSVSQKEQPPIQQRTNLPHNSRRLQRFDHRPPSELISSNLAEYFPQAGSKVLEQTMRNSIRFSNRLSRMSTFNSNRMSIATISSFATADSGSIPAVPELPADPTDNSVRTVTLESAAPSEDISDEQIIAMQSEAPKNWIKGTLIGQGSFGCVHLGMNSLTGELMAVKQVSLGDFSKTSHKQAMVDALQREMNLLRDFQHDNIVQYLGSSSDDEFLNIFLEYVPGGSVSSMLSKYGQFEEPLVRHFVRQILKGLDYLHSRNIIHRDIKGANVLVDNKGNVKISDFGISKKIEASSSNRQSLQGSVYWMAPEVVKQTSYTVKADIWSLGCLIVEMLTGSHPFPQFSQMQAIFKIGTSGSPDIPEKCSEDTKNLLKQTFEQDSTKRPSAADLLAHQFLA